MIVLIFLLLTLWVGNALGLHREDSLECQVFLSTPADDPRAVCVDFDSDGVARLTYMEDYDDRSRWRSCSDSDFLLLTPDECLSGHYEDDPDGCEGLGFVYSTSNQACWYPERPGSHPRFVYPDVKAVSSDATAAPVASAKTVSDMVRVTKEIVDPTDFTTPIHTVT
ncbi:hypothetical protein KIPB_013534, partial [Kipferlia bialata]|eukprot:g13534.t1